jgi:LmbE family N-acetylglucosaminyl deacetylase
LSDAIVVSPHPDDEVLGVSAVLTAHTCTVVFVTDGVPIGTPDAEDAASMRVQESRAAWTVLGAHIDEVVRLGFMDQRLATQVDDLGRALAHAIQQHPAARVYVPAYQRGHPDHDAAYVAAQLARAHCQADRDERAWFAYALYGLDCAHAPRFAWLDPEYFERPTTAGNGAEDLTRKTKALEKLASQLAPDSVLWGWLDDPVPEQYAPLPDRAAPLPALPCFYEEVFHFSQFGIDAEAVDSELRRALDAVST